MSDAKHLGSFEDHVAECIGDHGKHICELAKKVAFGEIRELVESPNFMCKNCARVAGKAENLCSPESLEKIAYHE